MVIRRGLVARRRRAQHEGLSLLAQLPQRGREKKPGVLWIMRLHVTGFDEALHHPRELAVEVLGEDREVAREVPVLHALPGRLDDPERNRKSHVEQAPVERELLVLEQQLA